MSSSENSSNALVITNNRGLNFKKDLEISNTQEDVRSKLSKLLENFKRLETLTILL